MTNNDFQIETRLYKLDPELHRRFQNAVCTLQIILSRYRQYFPEYTDHSELHSLTVIDYCNQLVGKNARHLNADELYVLLVSGYLHDVGMGIPQKDYETFCEEIDFGDYFDTHDRKDTTRIIRDFHNEFSGCFVRKYAELFELPSEEHTYAAIQTCRGHRKTDLFDEEEYPQRLVMPNGNVICLPYLAAILRLADELDVSAERNPVILYDISSIQDEKQLLEHKKHEAIRRMDITEESIILYVKTSEKEIHDAVQDLADKVQRTMDHCIDVTRKRTPYEITQRQVLIKDI